MTGNGFGELALLYNAPRYELQTTYLDLLLVQHWRIVTFGGLIDIHSGSRLNS